MKKSVILIILVLIFVISVAWTQKPNDEDKTQSKHRIIKIEGQHDVELKRRFDQLRIRQLDLDRAQAELGRAQAEYREYEKDVRIALGAIPIDKWRLVDDKQTAGRLVYEEVLTPPKP